MRAAPILVLLAAACKSPATVPNLESTAGPPARIPPARPSSEGPPEPSPPAKPAEASTLLDVSAPSTIELFWPGEDENPRPQDYPFALFEEDEGNRALACPNARVTPPPAGGHRCRFEDTSTIEVAGTKLWIGASQQGYEHEGMYGLELDVVVLAPFSHGVRPLFTFTALDLDVVDCSASLSMRRLQTIDLNGDGARELCIESISEQGVGLFAVMDLEDAKQTWRPLRRTRVRAAFQFDPDRLKLARQPDLDGACPSRGYVLPARFDLDDNDAFRERATLQGDPPLGRCPTNGSTSCVSELCAKVR